MTETQPNPDETAPSDLHHGLTSAEAARRLAMDGVNELPARRGAGTFDLLREIAGEPMFLLLLAGASLYFMIGSNGDALMLLAAIVAVVSITFVQRNKTERALARLRDLASPRALVIRDGQKTRIPGREIVRDDLLLLAEGDRVPADAVLLAARDVLVNESMLTGESVPVRKVRQPLDDPPAPSPTRGSALTPAPNLKSRPEPIPVAAAGTPGGDDQPFVYAGTLIVHGTAIGRVIATGPASAIGRIGAALDVAPLAASPLRRQMTLLIRRFALLASVLSLLLVAIHWLTRGDAVQAILSGITLAMAILPEEFPVVLTVFLAIGALRISASRVLTRRMDAIETLGATTVLCTDKTGTLTGNRMVIRAVFADGRIHRISDDRGTTLPEPYHQLVEYGILASERDPFDPMEQALHTLGRRTLGGSEHLHGEDPHWDVVRSYSLSPELLAMTRVWRTGRDPGRIVDFVVAAKGSPEAVADLCHLDAARLAAVEDAAAAMADEGLRVIGVARGMLRRGDTLDYANSRPGGSAGNVGSSAQSTDNTYDSDSDWPTHQHDIDYVFVGLVGLEDPLRPGVADAIALARSAGIRIVMITGDHPRTAQAIAGQLGLPTQVTTGSGIEALGDAELRALVQTTAVFARIVPQQKLRLVRALQANGEIVAMTGDGVNDAPALRSAHIGVAMGARGTDVAREAAALVVLDDDFGSIVAAMRHGRRVYDNLRKAVAYILAVHLPIVGVSFVPVLLGAPLLLMPAHVLFLELVIDPVCSIAFEAEPEEEDLMNRPPRHPAQPFFSGTMIAYALAQGMLALLVTLAVWWYLHTAAAAEDVVRTGLFVATVTAGLALVVNCRSFEHGTMNILRQRNAAFAWVLVAAVAGVVLVTLVPPLRDAFHFAPPDGRTVVIGAGAVIVTLLGSDLGKALARNVRTRRLY